MARTDFTQDIDGAFANRNGGMKHFSEVARSGNGNMTNDLLAEDSVDYMEYDGVGEKMEELSCQESAAVDGLGQLAPVARFRKPLPGETPPVKAGPGMTWLKRRVITGARAPGGSRLAKTKWVQVGQNRMSQLMNSGNLQGMGDFSAMGVASSVGIGLGAGLLLWLAFKGLKKA